MHTLYMRGREAMKWMLPLSLVLSRARTQHPLPVPPYSLQIFHSCFLSLHLSLYFHFYLSLAHVSPLSVSLSLSLSNTHSLSLFPSVSPN